MLRRKRQAATQPDLSGFVSPWREAVEETLASRRQLHSLLAQTPDGAVRERLLSVAERVETGVAAAWQIASRAQSTQSVVANLRAGEVNDRLKDAKRRLGRARDSGVDTSAIETEVRLLSEQHAAVSQLANAVDDAAERLRLLDLRLDAAVARAAQISLGNDPVGGLVSVESELATVVEELAALQAGLEAVQPHRPGP